MSEIKNSVWPIEWLTLIIKYMFDKLQNILRIKELYVELLT